MARYEYVDSQHNEPGNTDPVSKMCRWLDVSTSGFYHWRTRPQSAAAARRETLLARIRHHFEESEGTYGYRRIHADLTAEQTQCSPELVRQMMRQEGLVACQPRPFRVTTEADALAAANMPDLLTRDFTAVRPGVKFVGDITYVHTWQGFVYLATVIDCYSKKVVGWSIANHMRTELVADALKNAAATTLIEPDAVFHTDRGSVGGFNWSSQHPDLGGVQGWRWQTGVKRRVMRSKGCGDSGVRIGRCGPRCGLPVRLKPLGSCNGSFGG